MPNWFGPGEEEADNMENQPDDRFKGLFSHLKKEPVVPQNERIEQFTFFWHGPFSNWHMSEFIIKNISYCCVEQFMMAQKALVFKDTVAYKLIMASRDPKEMKRLGRNVIGFDPAKWAKVRMPIVKMGVKAKFSQSTILYDQLYKTKGTTLVEASPYDEIWGIGLAKDAPEAQNRATWKGLNLLGEALTEVRDELMIEEGLRMVAPYEVDVLVDALPFFNGKVIEQTKESITIEIDPNISREKFRLFKLAYDGCVRVVEEDSFKTDNSTWDGNKFSIIYKPIPRSTKDDRKMRFEKKTWKGK